MPDLSSFIGTAAAALVFGAIMFFSFIVAPTTFRALEEQPAATFIRAIFPWYYVYLALCAAIGGLALSFSPVTHVAALILFLVSVLAVKARYLLLPRVNANRDAMLAGDETAGRRFDILHRSSVALNVLQLIMAAIALYLIHEA